MKNWIKQNYVVAKEGYNHKNSNHEDRYVFNEMMKDAINDGAEDENISFEEAKNILENMPQEEYDTLLEAWNNEFDAWDKAEANKQNKEEEKRIARDKKITKILTKKILNYFFNEYCDFELIDMNLENEIFCDKIAYIITYNYQDEDYQAHYNAVRVVADYNNGDVKITEYPTELPEWAQQYE